MQQQTPTPLYPRHPADPRDSDYLLHARRDLAITGDRIHDLTLQLADVDTDMRELERQYECAWNALHVKYGRETDFHGRLRYPTDALRHAAATVEAEADDCMTTAFADIERHRQQIAQLRADRAAAQAHRADVRRELALAAAILATSPRPQLIPS